MNTSSARNYIVRLAVVSSVACAAWYFVVRPLGAGLEVQRVSLAAATAEIEAGQTQIIMSLQEPGEIIQELREQAESLKRFWSISADASVLYEEIDAVAKRYGVVVERVEPSRGGSKGAVGDEQEDAPAFNEIGYSIELVGSYEGVARFMRAIQNELGMARIDTVRITPALSIDQATQVRASIKSTHFQANGGLAAFEKSKEALP